MEESNSTMNKETAKEQSKEVFAEKQTAARAAPKLNRSPLHGLWALTNRDLRKWYTNPVQLFTSLIQPVVWLGLFGKAVNFGDFIAKAGGTKAQQNAILQLYFGTTSYFSFLACGMLAMVVLFTSAFSGMSVVFDRRFGFLNKALSTPVARGAVVMAKILQSVGRSLIQSAIVLVIAIILGMETGHFTVVGIAGAFIIIFLMATGLSALFTMLALRSSDWQTQVALINLINLPLLFASNAIFPRSQMPPWLQNVVNVNPVSYANDAVRQMLIGATGQFSLWLDFAVLIGFAVILSAIGIVLSWRLLSK
ncbi:MAG TPA: ABC transporter permease [Candidatus Acidoferrum sp.]|nr:ABC transporter permease [Candidatus Acidoferrum sp.]